MIDLPDNVITFSKFFKLSTDLFGTSSALPVTNPEATANNLSIIRQYLSNHQGETPDQLITAAKEASKSRIDPYIDPRDALLFANLDESTIYQLLDLANFMEMDSLIKSLSSFAAKDIVRTMSPEQFAQSLQNR